MNDERRQEADEGEKARRRTGRRWPRRLALALVVLVALFFAVIWGAGRRAQNDIENDLAAYRAAGEPATVDELNRWPALRSGSGANAVPLLRAAAAAVGIDPNAAAWKAAEGALHPPPHDDAEVAALDQLLEMNADALARLDEASAAGAIDWEPRFASPLMGTMLPPSDLPANRQLTRLAYAAVLAAHRRGDDAEALRRIEQIVFIGFALDHQPTLVHHLVAIGCGALASVASAEIAPELRIGTGAGEATPRRVRALIMLLSDERPLSEGQRRAWVGERVSQLDFPNPLFVPGGPGGPFGGGAWSIPGSRFVARSIFLDNARAMARHTTLLMKTTAASADLPAFNASLASIDPMPEATKSPRRYTLAAVLASSLRRSVDQHYWALADRRLAATCLAVRLYAVEHNGARPAALSDLVPVYLPSLPLDPLAGGGAPLRYANDEIDPTRPRIYSVGIDGSDDGGIERPENPPTTRGAAPARYDEVRHLKVQPRPVRPTE